MSTIPPTNPDSDVTLAASFGRSEGNSEYVKSSKNLPMSLANTPDLAGHTSELEIIHEVPEEEIYAIF